MKGAILCPSFSVIFLFLTGNINYTKLTNLILYNAYVSSCAMILGRSRDSVPQAFRRGGRCASTKRERRRRS
jgi:hypothetical protein